MLSGGEFRITMKIKQSMSSMPRLDFFAFQVRQGENYVIENGLRSNRMFAREKTLTNTFILLLVLDMVLLFLYVCLHPCSTKQAICRKWVSSGCPAASPCISLIVPLLPFSLHLPITTLPATRGEYNFEALK